MVSLKQKRQSGFTIVELLIVIIIIGILAGLVITQILGANQQARDSERKTDINSIASQLEVYFAKNAGYPAPEDLVSADWRKNNQFNAGDQSKALIAPGGAALSSADVSTATTISKYQYTTEGSCVSPTKTEGTPTETGTFCQKFTLSALLENHNDKQADAATFIYSKKNAE